MMYFVPVRTGIFLGHGRQTIQFSPIYKVLPSPKFVMFSSQLITIGTVYCH